MLQRLFPRFIGTVALLTTGAAITWGLYQQPAPAVVPLTIYNVATYGAISDGDLGKTAANTAACAAAINAMEASGGNGVLYVPPGKGIPVNNGVLKLSAPGNQVRGEASQGSQWGSPSLIGVGAGSTLTITANAGGTLVERLKYVQSRMGDQNNNDAFLDIRTVQCVARDLNLQNINVGVSLTLPFGTGGGTWLRDLLIQGQVGRAGVIANAGDSAINIQNMWMFPASGVNGAAQPPYGILITSAGEVDIGGGTNICNSGACLAILPGMNGVQNQYVVACEVANSLFDNGNGPGCVWISPSTNAYVERAAFNNVWCSSANNGEGRWNTNGFTFDGANSTPPPGLMSIRDVTLTGCCGKGFVQHCGLYCRGVYGLSVMNSTFSASYNGIQIASGMTNFLLSGNKCGNYAPPPLVQGAVSGNTAYGILVDKGCDQFIITNNLLYGNRAGLISLSLPSPRQVIGFNLQ